MRIVIGILMVIAVLAVMALLGYAILYPFLKVAGESDERAEREGEDA